MKETFRTIFSFKGRINRLRYFIYGTINFIIYLGIMIMANLMFSHNSPMFYFFCLSFLVFIAAAVSLNTQRLHDIGKSGVWQLLFLIPIINSIFIFYMILGEGQKGPNSYGLDPRMSGYPTNPPTK